MRVKYYTIRGGFYTGELVKVSVPIDRLSHNNDTTIEILGYDITIRLDDGAKVSFENVKLNDITALTDCSKCVHCEKKSSGNADSYFCPLTGNGVNTLKGHEVTDLGVFNACFLFERAQDKE